MAREARESFEARRFEFEDMQWRIKDEIASQRFNFEIDHARIAEEARAAVAMTPMPPPDRVRGKWLVIDFARARLNSRDRSSLY